MFHWHYHSCIYLSSSSKHRDIIHITVTSSLTTRLYRERVNNPSRPTHLSAPRSLVLISVHFLDQNITHKHRQKVVTFMHSHTTDCVHTIIPVLITQDRLRFINLTHHHDHKRRYSPSSRLYRLQ